VQRSCRTARDKPVRRRRLGVVIRTGAPRCQPSYAGVRDASGDAPMGSSCALTGRLLQSIIRSAYPIRNWHGRLRNKWITGARSTSQSQKGTRPSRNRSSPGRTRRHSKCPAVKFQGRLGWHRALLLVETDTDLFSNMDGVQQIRYPKGHIRDLRGRCCYSAQRVRNQRLA